MKKILIIDDEAVIREFLRELLEQNGFHVMEAENGKLGIALAQSFQPDLIICDVVMPNVDGFDALIAMRHRKETSKIPFIILTGMNYQSFRDQASELGADGFLTKPFSEKTLLAVIHPLIDKIT